LRRWLKPIWPIASSVCEAECTAISGSRRFGPTAYPVIGAIPVDAIETNDVLAVLRPHWESKCETMARLRGRIERILARATVEGLLQETMPWRRRVARA
jgi:hypothetical protein